MVALFLLTSFLNWHRRIFRDGGLGWSQIVIDLIVFESKRKDFETVLRLLLEVLFTNAFDPLILDILRTSRENETSLSIIPVKLAIAPYHRVFTLIVVLTELLVYDC